MLRRVCVIGLLAALSVIGASGCGGGACGEAFESNDLAKTVLGNTVWKDTDSGIELAFGEDARLIAVEAPGLAEEFGDVNISCEPFTVTIPPDTEFIGGATLTVTAGATETLVELDESGGYDIKMGFEGLVSGPGLAGLVDRIVFVITAKKNVGENLLTNVNGTWTAYAGLIGAVHTASMDFDETIPLGKVD